VSPLDQRLLRLLRVDERPQPPPGRSESLRVFRASPAYFRYSLLRWSFGQLGAFLGLLFSFSVFSFNFLPDFDFFGIDWVQRLETLAFVIFFVQAAVGFVRLRLEYRLRWYMVSDRSLRVREGCFHIREQTMTVANIQNMAIRRGPLQRAFGIADLEVRTAGGGAKSGDSNDVDSIGKDHHLARLRGLDDAEAVREILWSSLRRHRDAGLGDPDDRSRVPTTTRLATATDSATSERLAAARALLGEVRALRLTLSDVGRATR